MNILITGGSKGIGKAIIQELATNGSNTIYYTFNNTIPTFSYPNCHPIQVDLTITSQLELFVEIALGLELAAIINNYHTGYTLKHAHKVSTKELENGMSSNIYPIIKLTNALIPGFRKMKSGKIITLLTRYVYRFPTGASQYTAEKRYLSAFVEGWNQENKAIGINSYGIFPGIINTDFHNNMPHFVEFGSESDMELNKVLLKIKEILNVV
jgi:short-subunit dehydrogenase